MRKPYRYYIPDHGDTAADAIALRWERDHSPEAVAQEAAEHHCNHSDGHEHTWPITFAILMRDDTEYRVVVDRMMVPSFLAHGCHVVERRTDQTEARR